MLKPLLLLSLLAASLTACASSGAAQDEEPAFATSPPAEANRMQPDHAPTPYSADEIRAACGVGAFREFAMTEKNTTQHLRMVFGPDVDGAVTVDTILLGTDGSEAMTMPGQPTAWTALQGHASFPEAMTEITPCRHQTQAGTFDAWTYVVTAPDGTVTTFVFARDLAGPPIDMSTWQGGMLVSRMELVDYGPR